MPTLDVSIAPSEVEILSGDFEEVADDDPNWRLIKGRVLSFIWDSRPVYIVSDGIGGRSIVEDFPNARKVALPKKRWYHFRSWVWQSYTTNCRQESLNAVIDDYEFDIGLLCFTSVSPAAPEHSQRIADDSSYNLWENCGESVFGGCDGRVITWRRPNQTLKSRCVNAIEAIAQRVGWGITTR